MKIKIGQNILDVAAQETGIASNAYDIAKANNLVLTDEIDTDIEIAVPTLTNNKKVRDVFQRKNIKPSSSDNEVLDGIDFMTIQLDFIIQ